MEYCPFHLLGSTVSHQGPMDLTVLNLTLEFDWKTLFSSVASSLSVIFAQYSLIMMMIKDEEKY